MTVSSGKVITTLQDRWQIDQDIQEMLQVRSQQEFTDRAQQRGRARRAGRFRSSCTA